MTVMMIENEAAALKAAKKYLQKEESGALKLKELAKTIVSNLLDKKATDDGNDDKTTNKQTKQVRAWIEQSSKFEVNKKMVSLKSKDKSSRKRTISPETPVAEKASNNSKKSKKNISSSSSSTQKDMDQWRVENKIVVLDYTQQDEQGQSLSKQHNENPAFYPWTSFEHAAASGAIDNACSIDAALIRQCTGAGNKFLKPSPIQSQAWPILTSQADNGSSGRDIVGIAETGSGMCNTFHSFSILGFKKSRSHMIRECVLYLLLCYSRKNTGLCVACTFRHGSRRS
jgi:hypothetical protein